MLESLLEGMSEYYSKNLVREVMKGLRETALQCKHTGGAPPLGFDVGADKRLVVNPKEAEAVKMIFHLYGLGYGYSYIIQSLNENGYLTKRGKPFGKNSIHDILVNEKYSGMYVFNRSTSQDAFHRRNTHASKDTDSIIKIKGGCGRILRWHWLVKYGTGIPLK